MKKQENLDDDFKYVKVPEALYYELLSETEKKETAYHEKVVGSAAPSHPKAPKVVHHDLPPQHHDVPKHKDTVKH